MPEYEIRDRSGNVTGTISERPSGYDNYDGSYDSYSGSSPSSSGSGRSYSGAWWFARVAVSLVGAFILWEGRRIVLHGAHTMRSPYSDGVAATGGLIVIVFGLAVMGDGLALCAAIPFPDVGLGAFAAPFVLGGVVVWFALMIIGVGAACATAIGLLILIFGNPTTGLKTLGIGAVVALICGGPAMFLKERFNP